MPRKTISIKQKLKTIKPRIKRGDYANLSRKTGYDPSHVRRVLNGDSNPNTTIVNEAYKTIGRRKTIQA